MTPMTCWGAQILSPWMGGGWGEGLGDRVTVF